VSRRRTVEALGGDLGELIVRHDSGADLSRFARYADDPVGFIREVLGGEPWTKQEEIAGSAADHPLTVVRSANAVGKDWTAARLALWWFYACRGLALVTGPTERQVREVVMGEVTRAFRSTADLPGELCTSALRLGDTETAGILAFTSTEASRLTGFHAPRVPAVLTEAQGVEDFAWGGLLVCATCGEDRVLAVGNPLAPSGRFYGKSLVRLALSADPGLGAPEPRGGGYRHPRWPLPRLRRPHRAGVRQEFGDLPGKGRRRVPRHGG